MTARVDAIAVMDALSRRLGAIYPLLTRNGDERPAACADLLAQLVESLSADPASDRVWLLLTAIWAAYPPTSVVLEAQRILRLRPPVDALLHLLDSRMRLDSTSAATYDLHVVTDSVVVDVGQTATAVGPNPIGEMVRRTVAAWKPADPILLAAWSPGWRAWQPLTPAERARLSGDPSNRSAGDNWGLQGGLDDTRFEADDISHGSVCIVPWRAVVLLPEIPPLEVCDRLAGLAELSGNRVVMIGHDFSPVLEAQAVSPSEPSRFAHYLSVIKHSEMVAASSQSAAQGLSGFAGALGVQGLAGPEIARCFFATEATEDRTPTSQRLTADTVSRHAVVVSIGFLGPPADLSRILYAAEVLWGEGLGFQLRLLEGAPVDPTSRRSIIRLQEAGQPIILGDPTQGFDVAESLRSASFAIFAPRFDGYSPGLATCLSDGTPVIATRGAYVDEHASLGGVLTIDRDDRSLVAAMRLLLTDHQKLTALRSQAAVRPERTWSAFARDLWSIATRAPSIQGDPGEWQADPTDHPAQHSASERDGPTYGVQHLEAIARRRRPKRSRTVLEQRATDGPQVRGNLLDRRIRSFLAAVGESWVKPGLAAAIEVLEASLAGASYPHAWLAVSVLAGEVPLARDVIRLARAARLGRALSELDLILDEAGLWDAPHWPEVEVLADAVMVDVDHTARDLFATGIQRVSREVARRWHRDHEVVLVGWTDNHRAFRRLTPAQQGAALSPDRPEGASGEAGVTSAYPLGVPQSILVPWRCRVLVPELPIEGDRPLRYASFARFSQSTTGVVGHDCVPLTAAETCDEGVDYGFALWLGALSEMDRVAAVSASSAVEYEGWKTMLAGRPRKGPHVTAVPLAAEPSEPSLRDLARARQMFGSEGVPIVLAVGSHEPRKNHLALLSAAEQVWNEGVQFSLVFVGGNSWNSEIFEREVVRIRAESRRVHLVHRIEDGLLWAAYRIAHCTIFPSLQEGFGLPIAESLACGTPVITAGYGSMREQSDRGGVLLVNPRDDQDIAEALRRILLDRDLRNRLALEAAAAPKRSWDEYARETWSYLVDGISP